MTPPSRPAHSPTVEPSTGAIVYPDSDGQPMADNTEQFEFIQVFQGNLDALREDFVAGDHLWYPVEGHPEIRVAPDVYVAVGRPKGHRGSYKQWEEADTPLTVVFEWFSPRNYFPDQAKKLQFYERHGVAEFYAFDQNRRSFHAFLRDERGGLEPVSTEDGIVSPILGIRMEVVEGELRAWNPDGSPFLSMPEMKAEVGRAEAERDRAEARAAELAEKLRALGVDPDTL